LDKLKQQVRAYTVALAAGRSYGNQKRVGERLAHFKLDGGQLVAMATVGL